MNLSFKLNGGKEVILTYQEAELLYKDLQKIFGSPTPAPQLIYPPGVREISKPYRPEPTWCAQEHPREWLDQKEALAEMKLHGEAH